MSGSALARRIETCAPDSSIRDKPHAMHTMQAKIVPAISALSIKGTTSTDPTSRAECARRLATLGNGPNAFNALTSSLEYAFSESIDPKRLIDEIKRQGDYMCIDSLFEASLELVRHPDTLVSRMAAKSASLLATSASDQAVRRAFKKAILMLHDSNGASREGSARMLAGLYLHRSLDDAGRKHIVDSVRYHARKTEADSFFKAIESLPPRIIDAYAEAVA